MNMQIKDKFHHMCLKFVLTLLHQPVHLTKDNNPIGLQSNEQLMSLRMIL